jgi:hypothetical protein
MVDVNFLSNKVQSLLSQSASAKGPLRPPIDPVNLAALCGVLSVEHRPMVPEGVLTPVQGGFRIYLQSNFAHQKTAKHRERFTIAHELVHTFYYDRDGDVPKPIKRLPSKDALERLCHMGASQILVPEGLLKREAKTRGQVASVESLLDLAAVFDVSAEVLIRRLHETQLFASDKFAAILVEAISGNRRLIRAACYGPLLLCLAIRPRRGLDFESWVLPLVSPSRSPHTSEWTHRTRKATIVARKVYRSNRSFILDLRFGPPNTNAGYASDTINAQG